MSDKDEPSVEDFFKEEASRIRKSNSHRMSDFEQKISNSSTLSGASRHQCPDCEQTAIEYSRLSSRNSGLMMPGTQFQCRHCGIALRLSSSTWDVALGLSLGLYVCVIALYLIFPYSPLFDGLRAQLLMLLGPGALGLFIYHIGTRAVCLAGEGEA